MAKAGETTSEKDLIPWNEVTVAEMRDILVESLTKGFDRSLGIWGPPGVGKSAILAQAAAMTGHGFLDERVAQMDPTDLRGILCGSETGDARWLVNPRYKPLFEPDAKYVLGLDEFVHAGQMMQKACFEVAHDRAIGGNKFGKRVAVVFLGNREQDGCDVVPLEVPLQTRMAHFYVRFDFQTFFDHAQYAGGFHPLVLGWLKSRPDMAYKPTKQATDYYGEPMPRTWHAVSDALRTFSKGRREKVIAGQVGPGMATMFLEWSETYATLEPLIQRVVDGENVEAPDLSRQYFVCQSLVERMRHAKDAKEKGRLAGRVLDYAIALRQSHAEMGGIMIRSGYIADRDAINGHASFDKAMKVFARFLS